MEKSKPDMNPKETTDFSSKFPDIKKELLKMAKEAEKHVLSDKTLAAF